MFLGITFTASSMWSLAVVISTGTVAVSSPLLGVISDRIPIKKTLLWIYASAGSVFTALVFFSAYTSEPWAWLFGMLILANIGFAGSLVFYNSFLPHLGPRHLLDDISSRGFAFGYAGGGLILLIHLVLILATQDSDIEDLVTRAAIASIGLWWFGWALWTLRVVPEPPIRRPVSGLNAVTALSMGFRELGQTFRELARFRVVVVYLVAYLLFNDGLQTVIAVAGAFAADTPGHIPSLQHGDDCDHSVRGCAGRHRFRAARQANLHQVGPDRGSGRLDCHRPVRCGDCPSFPKRTRGLRPPAQLSRRYGRLHSGCCAGLRYGVALGRRTVDSQRRHSLEPTIRPQPAGGGTEHRRREVQPVHTRRRHGQRVRSRSCASQSTGPGRHRLVAFDCPRFALGPPWP